jgi:hypothetical protein
VELYGPARKMPEAIRREEGRLGEWDALMLERASGLDWAADESHCKSVEG